MRIESIDQRAFDYNDGLAPLLLTRLSKIVLLAGPNGAGKTRILQRIQMMNADLADLETRDLARRLFFQEKTGDILKVNTHTKVTVTNGIVSAFSIGVRVAAPVPATIVVASFVPNDLGLIDPDGLSKNDMRQSASDSIRLGVHLLNRNCLSYIQATQDRWWNATHQESTESETNKQTCIDTYQGLKQIIKDVLGVLLDRNVDGQATLYKRPIAQAGLSQGQRTLLLWCVALHAQGIDLRQAILILDTPENHLHPEAMIDAICRIIDANVDGQVWLATHSVPLLSALFSRYSEYLSLYFIRAGSVSYAGREPESVLLSLMGGEANLEALRSFVDLPMLLAANRFAAECLLDPGIVAAANAGDPQVATVQLEIESAALRRPVRVLDFGVGHGRLLDGLAAVTKGSLSESLDYVAWDLGDAPSPACKVAIEKVYGTSEGRWYHTRDGLFGSQQPGSFDRVVMCNVLHEIDPSEWLDLFAVDGVIARSLNATGSLLIVEDYLMPKGEYAHAYGFIVLNTEALQALFCAGAGDDAIKARDADSPYTGRIRAHIVPVQLLGRVTAESRKRSLELAVRSAEAEIKRIRAQRQRDYRTGQAHAFWVQQFTNLKLALRALDG